MPKGWVISEESLLAAMKNSYGNFSVITERLGCDRDTVKRRIEGTKSTKVTKVVKDLYAEEISKIADICESKILDIMEETVFKTFSVVDDSDPKDIKVKKITVEHASPQAARMIQFYAETKLKHLGYFTKQEISGQKEHFVRFGSLNTYKKAKKKYDKEK